jgi:hypothetical protein
MLRFWKSLLGFPSLGTSFAFRDGRICGGSLNEFDFDSVADGKLLKLDPTKMIVCSRLASGEPTDGKEEVRFSITDLPGFASDCANGIDDRVEDGKVFRARYAKFLSVQSYSECDHADN